TEVGNDGGFIHDDRHLDVVYKVVRFPSGTSKKNKRRQIKKAKKHYRNILLTLAKGKRTGLNREEKRVISLWTKSVTNRTLRKAADRIRFQLGQSNKFRAGLNRSGAWKKFINDNLSSMGLPLEIAALPHVESSYNPKAWSKVGAAGMWQFTRSTGRRFMRVDHVVDERMDPYLSSVAAARLLQYNYSILGSWPLALTAYNHGVAGMRRAVQKMGTKDIAVIVDNYKGRMFGFASRNFYAAFLAALDVSSNPQRFFTGLKLDKPDRPRTIKAPAFLAANALSRALGTDQKRLRQENPALRETVWRGTKYVPRGYDLRLPNNLSLPAARNAVNKLASLEGASEQKPDRFHRIRSGEALSTIARYYKTSVSELMTLNMLRNQHRIRAGQVLRLPVRGETNLPLKVATAKPVAPKPASAPRGGMYKVRRGDTLFDIARNFGIDEQQLISLNKLRNRHRIYPGQTLRVALVDKPIPTVAPSKPSQKVQPAAIMVASATPTTPTSQQNTAPKAPTSPVEDTVESQEEAVNEENPLQETNPTALSADPADYTVAKDETIEVQAEETLGHYAEWIGFRANQLRRINRMPYSRPLVIGKRLRLDFSRVSKERFEEQRIAYHRTMQTYFFGLHRIIRTSQHALRRGDSLWSLAQETYNIPVWLLRQYNPDLDFNAMLPNGTRVVIPHIERQTSSNSPEMRSTASG
ncbi:MAG: LysM peptidoglycan-binding domain-containing protein, partial [Gammaproteobacteria bacterium]|nr:LysM peptidoglycan-binding domain-containing protein [Gammaproteobacteria bacterium]